MSKTCAIGADFMVNGTVNTGKTIDIAIEGRIVKVDIAIGREGKLK